MGARHWTPAEMDLFGRFTDREIARKTGRSPSAVRLKRMRCGAPCVTAYVGREEIVLPASLLRRLGRVPDRILAEESGVSVNTIRNRRVERGIRPFGRRS